jgi:hypothetical protein
MSLAVRASPDVKPCYVVVMEISFTLDAEDYSRAWKLAHGPGWRVLVAAIPEFLAVAMTGAVIFLALDAISRLPSYLVSIIAVLWGAVASRLYMRLRYSRDTKNRGDVTVSLDRYKVAVLPAGREAFNSEWSAFKDWRSDRELVVLRLPSNDFRIIRTKTLSATERGELYDLLRLSLPKG